MIDPIKPIGAFIENTLRPLLTETKWFFDECEKHHLEINERNLKNVITFIAACHFRTVLVQFAQSVVITFLICLTWILSRILLS